MSNKHYSINEEFEVTLKVTVKIKSCSNYTKLSTSEIHSNIEDFKDSIEKHLEEKLINDYTDDVTYGVDYWSYEILKTK